jgi:hypothetical protein
MSLALGRLGPDKSAVFKNMNSEITKYYTIETVD